MPHHITLKKNHSFASWLTLIPLIIFSSSLAHAQDPPKKPNNHGWSGTGKFSFDANAGNTNTRKFKGSAKIVYNKDFNKEKPFKHSFGVSINKGSNSRSRDGERFETTDKEAANYILGYHISGRSSARAVAFYISDKKAKIDSFTMFGVGYEYDFIQSKRNTFNISGGLSNVNIEYNDGTPSIEGPAARLKLTYNGKLTKNFSLGQSFTGLGMEDLTMLTSNTSLKYNFTKRTAISLDHETTNYSSIANTAIDDTDDSTTLSLVFNF